MAEARDDLDLAAEALRAHRERQLAEQELDGDFAIQLESVASQTMAMPPRPIFTLETVAAHPAPSSVAGVATARGSSASHCSARAMIGSRSRDQQETKSCVDQTGGRRPE